MNAVIKADDVEASNKVRPLASGRTSQHASRLPLGEIATLRREVQGLSDEIALRNAEIERLGEDLSRAYRDGEASGRKLGLSEGDERRADYLALLAAGIERALDRFSDDLASLESLAPLIALEALHKVFDDPKTHSALIAPIIRRQLEGLETQSVISVRVSVEDFGDEEELRGLVGAIDRRGVEVAASDELKSGECRIKLKLGELEVGAPQQWTRLRGALLDLAGEQDVA